MGKDFIEILTKKQHRLFVGGGEAKEGASPPGMGHDARGLSRDCSLQSQNVLNSALAERGRMACYKPGSASQALPPQSPLSPASPWGRCGMISCSQEGDWSLLTPAEMG